MHTAAAVTVTLVAPANSDNTNYKPMCHKPMCHKPMCHCHKSITKQQHKLLAAPRATSPPPSSGAFRIPMQSRRGRDQWSPTQQVAGARASQGDHALEVPLDSWKCVLCVLNRWLISLLEQDFDRSLRTFATSSLSNIRPNTHYLSQDLSLNVQPGIYSGYPAL